MLCSRLLLLVRHSLSHCGRHGVLAARVGVLRLLHVLSVRNLLLLGGRHAIVGGHGVAARHVGGLRGHMGIADILGRIDSRFAVNAILIARCGLGSVEAGLNWSIGFTLMQKYVPTCIKFLPSAFVTSG